MSKNNIDKAIQEMRNERSMELFDLPESELSVNEVFKLDRYIHDIANPMWKQVIIDGEKLDYLVSNIGEVLSFKRGHLKILTKNLNNDNYFMVKLFADNKNYNISIHKLVAEAFIPNPFNKPQVNHIYPKHHHNKIKCNWVGNLEWTTSKENVDHAWQNGLVTANIGSKNGCTIYDDETIHNICKLLEKGKGATEISMILDVKKYIIDNIKNKNSWRHISRNYNIPESNKKKILRPDSTKEVALEMFNKGNFKYSDILNILGLPDTLEHRRYLSKLKADFNKSKVESSTTIDQLTNIS